MIPVELPIDRDFVLKHYKNFLTVEISDLCKIEIRYKRYIPKGLNKHITELHFFDRITTWYLGSLVVEDKHLDEPTGLYSLYDIIYYIRYLVINKSSLVSNYNMLHSFHIEKQLDLMIYPEDNKASLVHDFITVGDFLHLDEKKYKFTHPVESISKFMQHLIKVEVNG